MQHHTNYGRGNPNDKSNTGPDQRSSQLFLGDTILDRPVRKGYDSEMIASLGLRSTRNQCPTDQHSAVLTLSGPDSRSRMLHLTLMLVV